MVKKLNTAAVETVSSAGISPQTENKTRNLFVRVDTLDAKDAPVGTRIVDMYHFGTRNWLHNHQWWAMHNGHTVEVRVAADKEVTDYLISQKQALADKFNAEKAHVAAA